jgi:C-terminal processing protease CtpA/Prc
MAGMLIATSCKKKSDVSIDGTTQLTPKSGTKLELLKDSVYLYTKEVYLWNNVITPYAQFNPRGYGGSTEMQAAENVMNGVRALQPLDRYSFIATQEESEGLQTGEDRDFGFFISSAYTDKAQPYDSVGWFVSYVYNNSTAGRSGVQRGWQITAINGTQINGSNASVNLLNDVFFGAGTSATFQFRKPDGASVNALSLSKTSFISNSVLYRNVYTNGAKKIGYLVFNQFFAEPSRKELADVFSYFQGQGINELVVDLRYNRGGSTDTQDTLANLIAPASSNGKLMYKYVFNTTLQQNKHELIRKKLGLENVFKEENNSVNFKKAGTLNLSRVFFIVGHATASASELLINNLRPYMTVKLVGDTTYGKPVGFFPIPVYDFEIYPISFKTVNSTGNADYYTGFAPDALTTDGLTYNWGDVAEPSLSAALNFINTGSFRLTTSVTETSQRRFETAQALQPAQIKLEGGKFNGMFKEK